MNFASPTRARRVHELTQGVAPIAFEINKFQVHHRLGVPRARSQGCGACPRAHGKLRPTYWLLTLARPETPFPTNSFTAIPRPVITKNDGATEIVWSLKNPATR